MSYIQPTASVGSAWSLVRKWFTVYQATMSGGTLSKPHDGIIYITTLVKEQKKKGKKRTIAPFFSAVSWYWCNTFLTHGVSPVLYLC